jgi:hypothetical protein
MPTPKIKKKAAETKHKKKKFKNKNLRKRYAQNLTKNKSIQNLWQNLVHKVLGGKVWQKDLTQNLGINI